MEQLTEANKILFFKFLNGTITIQELEAEIYKSTTLEPELEPSLYLQLISFNFRDKYAIVELQKFILKNFIEAGQFETWKLKTLLIHFVNNYKDLDKQLDHFYHLYYGVYQQDGTRKWQYLFLQHLGLNYLHWLDEDNLKLHYGQKWRERYEKALNDFEFYHHQLKPFAEIILSAIDNGDILINNDGTYTISYEASQKLEGRIIFRLNDPT